MSSEHALWTTLRSNLSVYGRLQRIESPLVKGIPDVIYCLLGQTGWLELKELGAWPVRPTTNLRIPTLELEQILFMETWEAAPSNGSAHLLLQVDRTYLLLNSKMARKIYERSAVRAEIEANALVRGEAKLPTRALVKVLTKRDLLSD